jgi:hypothetical protein
MPAQRPQLGDPFSDVHVAAGQDPQTRRRAYQDADAPAVERRFDHPSRRGRRVGSPRSASIGATYGVGTVARIACAGLAEHVRRSVSSFPRRRRSAWPGRGVEAVLLVVCASCGRPGGALAAERSGSAVRRVGGGSAARRACGPTYTGLSPCSTSDRCLSTPMDSEWCFGQNRRVVVNRRCCRPSRPRRPYLARLEERGVMGERQPFGAAQQPRIASDDLGGARLRLVLFDPPPVVS